MRYNAPITLEKSEEVIAVTHPQEAADLAADI